MPGVSRFVSTASAVSLALASPLAPGRALVPGRSLVPGPAPALAPPLVPDPLRPWPPASALARRWPRDCGSVSFPSLAPGLTPYFLITKRDIVELVSEKCQCLVR